MRVHSCLGLVRQMRSHFLPIRQFTAAVAKFPSPPPDLPSSTVTPDARSLKAETLLSVSSPSADVAATAYTLASAAATAGCARGQVILGGLLDQGIGAIKSTARAHELFEKSARAGDPWGMLAFAQALMDEDVVHSDLQSPRIVLDDGRPKFEADGVEAQTPAQIVRESRKARRAAGFSDAEGAQFEMLKAAELERTRAVRREVAKQWLHAAAERGLDTAMVLRGNCAVEDEDYITGVKYYEDAIRAARNVDAYYNLGVLLDQGAKGVEREEKRAYKCIAMAAQLGDATAQSHLGRMMLEGTMNQESDPAAARTYLELAAAQLHPEALFRLAGMHRAGEGGLEACELKFLRFLRMAAESGYPDAAAELADLYYKGEGGVTQDNAEALRWFEQAGRNGHADAMCSAAAMHYHGHGTKVDKHTAFLRYQDAMAMDSLTAMRNLAAMYHQGDGVPRNHTLAEQFFKLADEKERAEIEQLEEINRQPIRTEAAPPHPMSEISEEMKK